MIIRELHLYGFGKFSDHTLKLEPGLNIIYGPNESGKSTLHSFISGMFYGFRKPYTKRALYSDDHDRLSPWSGAQYSGSIVFEMDSQLYRIYRVFDKGKEETRVFHEETGEDITDRVHNGENSKVLQPGEHFFGINGGVFKNTLFIGQQDIAPGKSLASEVRERLINVSTGGDENISVEKAISILDEELKEIGTTRASTSEYGRLVTDIEETEEKLKNVEAEAEKYREHLNGRKVILEQLRALDMEIHESRESIAKMDKLEKISKYSEVIELRHRNSRLGEEIEILAIHEAKSQEDYDEAVKLSEEIGIVKSRIDSAKEQLEELEEKSNRILATSNQEEIIPLEVIEDGYRFQKLDYQNNEDRDLMILRGEIGNLKRVRLVFRWYLSIVAIIYFSLHAVALMQGRYSILAIAQIFLIPVFYFLMRIRSLKGLITKLETAMEVELEKDALLKKYKLPDKYELYKLADRARTESTKAEQERDLLAELQESRESLSERINNLNMDLMAMEKMLGVILSNNQAEDMKSFHEGLEKKSRLREIKREIEYNHETIKRILKDENVEELEHLYELRQSIGLDSDSKLMSKTLDYHEKLLEKKDDMLLDIKKIEGSLSQLEYSLDLELSLNEKLEGLKKREGYLRNRRESLEMARKRINDLSSEIHREFAPSLNKRVGEFIAGITAGRYTGVKVDKNLDFNLVHAGTKRMVPLKNLSGGALDQMYLGLRLGIVDELISSTLPIFLDECFSQYDDIRLRRILEFITSLEDRQVVLFTCQNREEEAVKATGKKYNKIDLQYS